MCFAICRTEAASYWHPKRVMKVEVFTSHYVMYRYVAVVGRMSVNGGDLLHAYRISPFVIERHDVFRNFVMLDARFQVLHRSCPAHVVVWPQASNVGCLWGLLTGQADEIEVARYEYRSSRPYLLVCASM